jgi:hypothetical protein
MRTSGSKTAIIFVSGAPNASIGFAGDLALDTTNGVLYFKATDALWSAGYDIAIPPGDGNANHFLSGLNVYTSIPLAALAALLPGTSLADGVNEGTLLNANGAFTPNSSAKYIIALQAGGAGGGGGGGGAAGIGGEGGLGGGEGQYLVTITELVAATAYNVVVGAAAAGGNGGGAGANGTNGTVGNATTFIGGAVNLSAAGGALGRLGAGSTFTGSGSGSHGGTGIGPGGGAGGQGTAGVGSAGTAAAANSGAGGGGGGGGSNANGGGNGAAGGTGYALIIRA